MNEIEKRLAERERTLDYSNSTYGTGRTTQAGARQCSR